MRNKPVAAAAAAAALLSAAVAPAWAEPVKSIVLVHGAFADGSGSRDVADILGKDGYTVSVVQEPLTSLAQAASLIDSVVLVYGAFVDGSGWKAAYGRLCRRPPG